MCISMLSSGWDLQPVKAEADGASQPRRRHAAKDAHKTNSCAIEDGGEREMSLLGQRT